MRIEKPGIYRGVHGPDYFADPCPVPSLTQSLAKLLIERSPLHAWTASQRLNPNFEADNDPKFDVGNAAHKLILGRGKDFGIIDAPDWRTKAAKEAREAAELNGKIGILSHEFDRATDMLTSASDQLRNHEDKDAFTDGDAEVMICWEENGIWFRSLIDWLHTDLRTVDDYKTTAKSIAPHVIGFVAEAGQWHLQAAFIERGLNVLDPDNAGRRTFRFVAQETNHPHALNVMHMDEHWLTMGRKKVKAAIGIWTHAIKSGRWDGYPRRSIIPEYPGYKETQWLERELSGEFDPDAANLMAG